MYDRIFFRSAQNVTDVSFFCSALNAQKPLKWSSTTIIFDAEDHPDRTTAVGCLPLLVSPMIRNLKVNKMLVDGGAGLNLISPIVIKRLQIPDGDIEEMGTFQGVNPGMSQPKGKVSWSCHDRCP